MAEKSGPETGGGEKSPGLIRAWAVDPKRFAQPRPASGASRSPEPKVFLGNSATQVQLEETGITWDRSAVDWSLLERSTVDRVRSRFRASLPEYIWDAAALEGNPYTLPEVQTLLEGITVTGHRIADQDQILALNEGFNLIDKLVSGLVDGRNFHLDKATSDEVHAKVAVHEAIESGHFRGEGAAGGGGHVSIGALGTFHASEPGENGANLKREFRRLTAYLLEDLEDPREQAVAYFCAATRRHFYFDGNKRTSKLMMAGHLMNNGYDAISISARRQLEFNQLLAPLFDDGDATEMMRFIIDSRPE
ncbi:hypothetical protein GCM10022381_27820 [Leifsonia kafniensis]|uniref:Fido domain-containing protein n=1 Tax=Leifsonia kafniensis TaxID=475957 RepID=A0ABP7KPQ5_9MICO